jgi:hypothetical protein
LRLPAPRPCAADAQVELGADPALILVRALEADAQLLVLRGRARPPFHPARGLDPRHGRDEPGARQPERRREGLARVVERRLLGDGGAPERAADDDAPKRARRPSQLSFDGAAVSVTVHRRRS